MLMNLGYEAAVNSSQTDTHPDCIVFQDVDVVPVDNRNPYICGDTPHHLVTQLNNQT